MTWPRRVAAAVGPAAYPSSVTVRVHFDRPLADGESTAHALAREIDDALKRGDVTWRAPARHGCASAVAIGGQVCPPRQD